MRWNFPISFVDSLIWALRAKSDYDKTSPYRVDGTIVGNGSQDFTRDYRSYAFEIGGVSTQLIDCPGIEGDESQFRRIIDNALKKCHLVCYVAREAKGIETTTLERIRSYLGENVDVIGIQNIPFNPKKEYEGADYDGEMRDRIAKDAENSCNIEQALLSVLPQDLYVRTVSMSALPGLCGTAFRDGETTFADASYFEANDAVRESLETLIRQQRNFLRHTTPSNLRDSSRIAELRQAIVSCCQNAPVRIRRNAYRRLLQALREIYLEPLKKEEAELKQLKGKVKRKVDAYVKSVSDAKFQLSRNMQHAVRDAIDEFYRSDVLEKIVYPHIERNVGIEEDELELELENDKANLSRNLKTKIDAAVKSATSEFCERIQQYTGELVRGMKLDISSIGVDMPYLEGESFGLADFGSWMMNIGGYALSGGAIGSCFGGPIGAAIGAIAGGAVGLVLKIVEFFMSDAKKIVKAKNKAKEKFEGKSKELFEQMEQGIGQCVAMVAGKTDDGVLKANNKKVVADEIYKLVCRAIEELTKIEQSLVARAEWASPEPEME